MLYKVVLVDDEAWILAGLQNAIQWEEAGFLVAGTYCNGKEALNAILKDPPDALLTDIKMPILDGISLVNQLRAAGLSQIEVVFLSGYDDFELAQSSLRLGAVDYVLKPSEPEQILEVFRRIKERMDQRRRQEEERQEAQELVRSGVRAFKESVFDCIAYGSDSRYEKMMSMYTRFVEREKGKPFTVISAALKNTVEEGRPQEGEGEAICLLKKLARETEVDFIENQFSCSFIISGLDMEEREQFTQGLKRSFRKESGKELVCAQSQVCHDFRMVKAEYERSLERLYQLHMPPDTRRLYKSLCNDTALKAALEDRDRQVILWSLKNWMVQIDKTQEEDRMRLLKRLIYCISIYFSELGVSVRTISRLYDFGAEASCEEVKERIISFVQSEFLKETQSQGRNAHLCREVANYISKNYSDDITLNDLADRFYISPNYLGTLFKKNLGMGIREYQTTIRLEQADVLIASRKFKLYQVAEMVGYPNYEYFRKIYCRYRGKNPSE